MGYNKPTYTLWEPDILLQKVTLSYQYLNQGTKRPYNF